MVVFRCINIFVSIFILSASLFAGGPGFDNLTDESGTTLQGDQDRQTGSSSKGSASKPRFYSGAEKKKAVLVRASKIAIPPTAQLAANRVKGLFSGSPGTQKTIDHFTDQYLVDGKETISKLQGMGYEVIEAYSSEFKSGREYKNYLKKIVQDPSLEVLIFFGHGDKSNGVAMYYPTEYAFQDPKDLKAITGGGVPGGSTSLTARDLKDWLGDRKLKGLILMSCNGAFQTYLHNHSVPGMNAYAHPRWDEVVDEKGFFAGFATYSLYFDPKTPKILSAMERHFKKARSREIYYIRTGEFLRKISLIGGLDDGENYYKFLANDKDVHVHDEKVDGLTSSLVNLVDHLKDKDQTLLSSMKTFLQEHQKFLKEEHVANHHNDGSFQGELSENPGVEEINAYVNAHANSVLSVALKALSPDLILPLKTKLRFHNSNPNLVSLDARFQIKRGNGLKKVFDLLSGEIGAVKGLDEKILKDNIKQLAGEFPGLDLDLKIDLEREVQGNKVKVKPVIMGYRIYLGDKPSTLPKQTSPYEVHADVKSLNRFVSAALERQFSKREQIFHQDLKVTDISGSIKLHEFKGINNYYRSRDSFDISAKWEFEIDWPVVGKRYAYATSVIHIKRVLLKRANTFRLVPEIELRLENGWAPKVRFGQSLLDKAVKWVLGKGIEATFFFFEKKFNDLLQKEIGAHIPKDPITSKKQILKLLSVDSDSKKILGKFDGMVFDLNLLMPGAKAQELVVDRIRVKDLYSTRSRLSCLVELR